MHIIRDRCFSDQVDEFRLKFFSYGRDGTQKFVDKAGNAIFVNRENVVVELYSKDAGGVVDELELELYPQRDWPELTGNERAAREKRREEFRAALSVFLKSLPSFEDLPRKDQQMIMEVSENLECRIVWLNSVCDDGNGDIERGHDGFVSLKE